MNTQVFYNVLINARQKLSSEKEKKNYLLMLLCCAFSLADVAMFDVSHNCYPLLGKKLFTIRLLFSTTPTS